MVVCNGSRVVVSHQIFYEQINKKQKLKINLLVNHIASTENISRKNDFFSISIRNHFINKEYKKTHLTVAKATTALISIKM